MMDLDPTEIFRQEAAELLETLETVLLDLGQRPGDGDLVDAAFRALHTIKGSGAMFGFDRVAAFTHDFETAFDLIRKGRIVADHEIVTVSLSAKDYIRTLIEDPDSTDAIIGEAIVAELHRLVSGLGSGGAGARPPSRKPPLPRPRPPPRRPAGRSGSPSTPTSCATAPTRSACSTSCATSAPARSLPISAPCPRSPRSIPSTASSAGPSGCTPPARARRSRTCSCSSPTR